MILFMSRLLTICPIPTIKKTILTVDMGNCTVRSMEKIVMPMKMKEIMTYMIFKKGKRVFLLQRVEITSVELQSSMIG